MRPFTLALLLALELSPARTIATKPIPVFPDSQDDTIPGQPCCAFATQRPGAEVVAFYEKHLGAKALGPDEVAARYPAHAQQMAMVKQMSGGGRKVFYFVLTEEGSGAGRSAVLLTINEMPALGTTIAIPDGWAAGGPSGAPATGKPQPPSKFEVAAKSFERQTLDLERQEREGLLRHVQGLPLARKEDYNLPIPDGARRETGLLTSYTNRNCYHAKLYVAEPYARVAPGYEKRLRAALRLRDRGHDSLHFGEKQFALSAVEEGGHGDPRVDAYGRKGGLNRQVLISAMSDEVTVIDLDSDIADTSCAITYPTTTIWHPGPIPEGLR